MKKLIMFITSIFISVAAMAQHVVNCDFTSQTTNITSNTEWSNPLYRVEGCIHVTNGHTLTIDAGVLVLFEKSVSAALIIDKGAKLVVNGNSTSPVVFTSDQTPSNKAYGDWDGLIIEGQAPNNVSGGSISLSGRTCSSLSGGGSTSADNSGTIEYLRIEYAKYGITFLSVGSGTTVDHVQTSFIANNAFEFLGGTVNAKNLISYNVKGNDFVYTDGTQSKLQFAVSVRLDVSNAHLSTGSNAVVITNDATGSSNTPLSHPIISDMTAIGPLYCGASGISSDYKNAILYDDNANGGIYNSIITGWPTGLLMNDAPSMNNANSSPWSLNASDNSYLSNTTDYNTGTTWPSGCQLSLNFWMINHSGSIGSCQQLNNQFSPFTSGLSSTICGTYSSTPPSFQLSSNTLNFVDYGDASDLSNAFFTTTGSRKHGGFFTTAASDWTTSWTNWDPQNFNPCPEGRMSNPTGISNLSTENSIGLKLAPNPSNGTAYAIFNATTDGSTTITVVDNAGRTLRTTQVSVTKGNQRIAVDTKGLAAGIYIIKVQSSNNLMHAQLVVE